jgi:uncharacterized protein YbbC (DUF1343 family)
MEIRRIGPATLLDVPLEKISFLATKSSKFMGKTEMMNKCRKIGALIAFTILSTGAAHAQAVVGAERMSHYLPILHGKSVAIIANQSSLIGSKHLVDTLVELGMDIRAVFAPEHGFRGMADNGEWIKDEVDSKTGLPIRSMYGKNKRLPLEWLKDIDVLIFDLQDVGARYYTYIGTMTYAMEACAESGTELIILDRPNPNGSFVDGPINKLEEPSFVAMHPVPIVHGMTVGEYAQMLVGEAWLETEQELNLTIVPCDRYRHADTYTPPVAPSPNLPNLTAIRLYPSLCLFEGTVVSIGRGTDLPFQIVGAPFMQGDLTFTPEPKPGAKYPKLEGVECHGYDLRFFIDFLQSEQEIVLFWLIDAYNQSDDKAHFFLENGFFDLLAGGPELREQIESGMTEGEIRATWQEELSIFNQIRKKYLIYK